MPRQYRNSSIELLRIFAIFMIVMAHLSGHGIMHVGNLDSVGTIWRGGGY